MMSESPARAFLLGAQKSGTTTLAELLARHPDIAVSEPKEPQYYWTQYAKGRGWFDACFPAIGDVQLDASTSYTMAHPEHLDGRETWPVPARLHADFPEARFLYIVRDPAARAISAYWHEARAGREARDIDEAISEDSQYVATSRYAAQIGEFLKLFPRERFFFIPFADLKTRGVETARAAAAHLGVDPDRLEDEPTRAANSSYQFSAAGRLARAALGGEAGMQKVAAFAKRVLPGSVQSMVKSALTEPTPKASDALIERLRSWLKDDADAFADIAGFQVME